MNEKVFRDSIHNYITVNHSVVYDLINTAEFQRLRRIKQVPTTAFTFHGAEHSRFSHCLGVYDIARRVTEIFEEKFPDIWNTDENLLTMVARSEEHTSELQSRFDLVCRLLLAKKNETGGLRYQ